MFQRIGRWLLGGGHRNPGISEGRREVTASPIVNEGGGTNRRGAEDAEEEVRESSADLAAQEAERWFKRGVQQIEEGDFRGAVASFDQALSIRPSYYRAWYKRGGALEKLGKYEEAIASYDIALAINPDFYQAWFNRGNALSKLGKYEEAIASYDIALVINPDDDETSYNRGVALANLEDSE